MTSHDVLDIRLSDIDIPDDRARDLDEAWAEALAGIIAAQGLTNPITVRATGDRYRLVTGLHRLEAFRLNQQASIPARLSLAANDDEARLEEVMENLGRNELKVLDKAHHLYEFQQVYERLYPEAKNGGDRKSEKIRRHNVPSDLEGGDADGKRPNWPLATDGTDEPTEVFGFAKATAEKTGWSDRNIRLHVSIWKSLSVASRARAAGTWLADHRGNLMALSAQTPAIQKHVLELMLADEPKAGSVADALTIIELGRLPSHVEKKFQSIGKAIRGLKDEELDTVLSAHADRIIGWAKRTGRI